METPCLLASSGRLRRAVLGVRGPDGGLRLRLAPLKSVRADVVRAYRRNVMGYEDGMVTMVQGMIAAGDTDYADVAADALPPGWAHRALVTEKVAGANPSQPEKCDVGVGPDSPAICVRESPVFPPDTPPTAHRVPTGAAAVQTRDVGIGTDDPPTPIDEVAIRCPDTPPAADVAGDELAVHDDDDAMAIELAGRVPMVDACVNTDFTGENFGRMLESVRRIPGMAAKIEGAERLVGVVRRERDGLLEKIRSLESEAQEARRGRNGCVQSCKTRVAGFNVYARNFYDLLGLPIGTDADEVVRRWRRILAFIHPDKNRTQVAMATELASVGNFAMDHIFTNKTATARYLRLVRSPGYIPHGGINTDTAAMKKAVTGGGTPTYSPSPSFIVSAHLLASE